MAWEPVPKGAAGMGGGGGGPPQDAGDTSETHSYSWILDIGSSFPGSHRLPWVTWRKSLDLSGPQFPQWGKGLLFPLPDLEGKLEHVVQCSPGEWEGVDGSLWDC